MQPRSVAFLRDGYTVFPVGGEDTASCPAARAIRRFIRQHQRSTRELVIDNGRGLLSSDGRRQIKVTKADLDAHPVLADRLEAVVVGLCRAMPKLGARLRAAVTNSTAAAAQDVCELHLLYFDDACGGPPTAGVRHQCSRAQGCPKAGIPQQALHVDYRVLWRDAVQGLGANVELSRMPYFVVAACTSSPLSLNVAGRLSCLGLPACRRVHKKHLLVHDAVGKLVVGPSSAVVCAGDLEHAGAAGTTSARAPRLHVGVCPKESGEHMYTTVDESFLLTRGGGTYTAAVHVAVP